MDESKGDSSKNPQLSSSPSCDPLEESTEAATAAIAPFISPSVYVTQQQFEAVNPKRSKYSEGQWKLLPSQSPSQIHTIPASSSDTVSSSPSHSPTLCHHQFRKGKYVSPIWKPHEMLWLAKAWKIQYETGSSTSSSSKTEQTERGKTRADKDREVAEFLNRNGVTRDAKTAGTKWDNMLGEFRKVFEWERDQIGKSYFRLSPYERKIHRLPASFDEQVFEELSHFMGSRIRTSQSRGASSIPLPPPPPSKQDEAMTKQLVIVSSGEEEFFHGNRPKELRRIGKVRMTWEESVSIWAEEGEHHRGRVRFQDSSFLNANELTYMDDAMIACTMEGFEDGPLKGFSVDRFVTGQQVKILGRRKSSSASIEPSIRSIPPWEFQDPTEYYMGCLKLPPSTLPSLFELSWHIQEPPSEELRFPLRKDIYRDLPQGKELFFTTSTELLDCRAITCDILSPIIRPNPSITAATATSRDSFIGLWDDCINRVISKFCSLEMVMIRKPISSSADQTLQDQWPNVTGFVKNLCLWRGEEIDQLKDGQTDPASSLIEKHLWTFMDLPYILGYYAVGYIVTFCAISRSQDRVIRTDLYSLDLSSPAERLKALVPCYRISSLLPLLADKCYNSGENYTPYSDFERIDLGNGNLVEMTPNFVTKYFSSKKKWAAVKEIYDFLDQRIPHSELIHRSIEKDLAIDFKPRGLKLKPTNCHQLIESLKYVTKALVALHDLSFMHRDLSWENVMRRTDEENEWFVSGFEQSVGAPQIYPHTTDVKAERGRQAPEMGRGLHGVKVDVWGVGYLVKSSGLNGLPKMLRELQNRCLDQNPEQRPTAADCYHHLLQLQSSLSAAGDG